MEHKTNHQDDDDDDDSENDSDFVPEEVELNDEVKKNDKKNRTSGVGLNVNDLLKKKKIEKKINSLWSSLQEEDKCYLQEKKLSAVGNHSNKLKKSIKQNGNYMDNILAGIFGKKTTKKLMKHNDIDVEGPSSDVPTDRKRKLLTDKTNTLKKKAKEAVSKIQSQNKNFEEIRKFAGQQIKITRKMNDANVVKQMEAPKSQLDNVIDMIKGPKSISTIVKSSIDWDNFKDQQGLDDELADASKDGYITKKEFLDRCDVRSYEKDKEVRLKGN